MAKRSSGCHGKAKNNDNNCKPCLRAEIAVLKEEISAWLGLTRAMAWNVLWVGLMGMGDGDKELVA